MSCLPALMSAMLVSSSPSNLVVNGGFEVSPWTDWVVGGNGIDHVGFWQAAEGQYCVDLSRYDAGSVAQTIPTTPGTFYRLEFAMAGNPDGGTDYPPPGLPYEVIKQMQVVWGAAGAARLEQTLAFDVTGRTRTNMGWENHQYIVQATDTATQLSFISLVNNYFGPALDAVTLVEIPEPTSLSLLALGGLALMRWRV